MYLNIVILATKEGYYEHTVLSVFLTNLFVDTFKQFQNSFRFHLGLL